MCQNIRFIPSTETALEAHTTVQTEVGPISNSRLPRRRCRVPWDVLYMVRPRRHLGSLQIEFADKHVYLSRCFSCRNILASRHSPRCLSGRASNLAITMRLFIHSCRFLRTLIGFRAALDRFLVFCSLLVPQTSQPVEQLIAIHASLVFVVLIFGGIRA